MSFGVVLGKQSEAGRNFHAEKESVSGGAESGLYCDRQGARGEVGEQAELVLFCEVVTGAESTPEVLKRQHLCFLFMAKGTP